MTNFRHGNLTLVAQNVNVPSGGNFVSPWIDTADCARLTILTLPAANPSLYLSADGVTAFTAVGPATAAAGVGGVYYFDLSYGEPVVAPRAAVAFGSLAVVDKAWLFCSQ